METFQRGSLTFDVRDGGPPDGEPVVLLHGFPQDSRSYDRMLPALHAAGLRTLAGVIREGYESFETKLRASMNLPKAETKARKRS